VVRGASDGWSVRLFRYGFGRARFGVPAARMPGSGGGPVDGGVQLLECGVPDPSPCNDDSSTMMSMFETRCPKRHCVNLALVSLGMKISFGNVQFRAGDRVELGSPAEIAATLDVMSDFDGLPFMPEMTPLFGRSFSWQLRRPAYATPSQEAGFVALPTPSCCAKGGATASSTAAGRPDAC
jgi:hypothetical protein